MGYGFDKNSHAFHLALAGYKFIGTPDVFVIHRAHEQSDWNGPNQKTQQVLSYQFSSLSRNFNEIIKWEALQLLCEELPKLRKQYGREENVSAINEPNPDNCLNTSHW